MYAQGYLIWGDGHQVAPFRVPTHVRHETVNVIRQRCGSHSTVGHYPNIFLEGENHDVKIQILTQKLLHSCLIATPAQCHNRRVKYLRSPLVVHAILPDHVFIGHVCAVPPHPAVARVLDERLHHRSIIAHTLEKSFGVVVATHSDQTWIDDVPRRPVLVVTEKLAEAKGGSCNSLA